MLSTILLYVGLFMSGLSYTPHSSALAPPRELCRLSGSVYVTDDPQRAHYYVYVADYESAADLSVFVEENKLYADQPGLWFFIEQEAFADFSVYFTDNRGMADFIIYYTDVASFAGCRK